MRFSRIIFGNSVRWLIGITFLCFLTTCGGSLPLSPTDPDTYESTAAYKYQPLNPTTVWINDYTGCETGYSDAKETGAEFNAALLRDLDTETVRISLTSLDANTKVSGAVGASVEGSSYVLTVDYIKYLTSKKSLKVKWSNKTSPDAGMEDQMEAITVPMYVGIGVRVRAEFKTLKADLDISSLPAVAVQANAGALKGGLTLQTMGITGSEISPLIPIISDISVSSIQNAVQAAAAIKAKIYDPGTVVYPKIIGFESPSDDPSVIHEITKAMYNAHVSITPTLASDPDSKDKIYFINWEGIGEKSEDTEESAICDEEDTSSDEETPVSDTDSATNE